MKSPKNGQSADSSSEPVDHADRPEDLGLRTKRFALRIIRLYMAIKKSGLGEILGKQLVRSGTSVGAHFAEANHSKSPADFINKLQGARQEMEETLYWIDLCTESELVTEKKVAGLVAEGREIIAIMVTMTNNAKKRL